MAKKQRKYDMEYKIQAVKPAMELGDAKADARWSYFPQDSRHCNASLFSSSFIPCTLT